ncbi:permease-like cell division protein FtsX [bacterium]|nr:permease-like cell division protein FtsX [bacterium]
MLSNGLYQAWTNLRENGSAAVSGIITTCISLVILGSVILVYLNLISLSELIFQKANYSVFISADTDETVRKNIIKHLEQIEGVSNIHRISSENAYKDLIESFGESGQVLKTIELPYLPDIIEFSLERRNILSTNEKEKIRSIPGVNDFVSGLETKDQIETFFTISEFVGIFLITLLIVSIILMLHSAIQIAVRMRIKEIEILKILGATHSYIKFPFIIEGILISIIGYFLSLGIIYLLYTFVIAGITFNEATYGIREIAEFFSLFQMAIIFGLIILLGIFSSSLATNKVLRELVA